VTGRCGAREFSIKEKRVLIRMDKKGLAGVIVRFVTSWRVVPGNSKQVIISID
jgi:hypothetical protein